MATIYDINIHSGVNNVRTGYQNAGHRVYGHPLSKTRTTVKIANRKFSSSGIQILYGRFERL